MSETETETGRVLGECDQCAYREWRPADQEPWLCVICGYERWRAVGVDEGTEAPREAPE